MTFAQYVASIIPYTLAKVFGDINGTSGALYNAASREVSLKLQEIRRRATQNAGFAVDISDLLPLHQPYTVTKAGELEFASVVNSAIAGLSDPNKTSIDIAQMVRGIVKTSVVTAPDVSLLAVQVGPLMGEYVDPVGTRRNRYLMPDNKALAALKPGTLFRDVRDFWLAWMGKTELSEQFEGYSGEAYEVGLG
jgi:hypothetical protein